MKSSTKLEKMVEDLIYIKIITDKDLKEYFKTNKLYEENKADITDCIRTLQGLSSILKAIKK